MVFMVVWVLFLKKWSKQKRDVNEQSWHVYTTLVWDFIPDWAYLVSSTPPQMKLLWYDWYEISDWYHVNRHRTTRGNQDRLVMSWTLYWYDVNIPWDPRQTELLTIWLTYSRPFSWKGNRTGSLCVEGGKVPSSEAPWWTRSLVINYPQSINHLLVYYFVNHKLIEDVFISEVEFICYWKKKYRHFHLSVDTWRKKHVLIRH